MAAEILFLGTVLILRPEKLKPMSLLISTISQDLEMGSQRWNIEFMRKDKFIRSLKKEYLLFKKSRKKMHELLKNGFSSALTDDDFHFIDSEVLQALYLNTIEKGVGGVAHCDYNKSKSVDLNRVDCQKLNLANETINEFSDAWIYVIPTEWHLCGGVLVSLQAFFTNFLDLSYLMQDDFDVFDSTLNNSLECRGDRSENELVSCSIVSRGQYFSFVIDLNLEH